MKLYEQPDESWSEVPTDTSVEANERGLIVVDDFIDGVTHVPIPWSVIDKLRPWGPLPAGGARALVSNTVKALAELVRAGLATAPQSKATSDAAEALEELEGRLLCSCGASRVIGSCSSHCDNDD